MVSAVLAIALFASPVTKGKVVMTHEGLGPMSRTNAAQLSSVAGYCWGHHAWNELTKACVFADGPDWFWSLSSAAENEYCPVFPAYRSMTERWVRSTITEGATLARLCVEKTGEGWTVTAAVGKRVVDPKVALVWAKKDEATIACDAP